MAAATATGDLPSAPVFGFGLAVALALLGGSIGAGVVLLLVLL
jgi:hypothetical protein